MLGCADGSEGQIFENNKMVGCDGRFTKDNFRTGCSSRWHVATASDYYSYGGKTVQPNLPRFVDVTWDSSGKETSLDNWKGYYPFTSSDGDWIIVLAGGDCGCCWLSANMTCGLIFINKNYGRSYGCDCLSEESSGGVVCVRDSSK